LVLHHFLPDFYKDSQMNFSCTSEETLWLKKKKTGSCFVFKLRLASNLKSPCARLPSAGIIAYTTMHCFERDFRLELLTNTHPVRTLGLWWRDQMHSQFDVNMLFGVRAGML
jgi:hypothetical protein